MICWIIFNLVPDMALCASKKWAMEMTPILPRHSYTTNNLRVSALGFLVGGGGGVPHCHPLPVALDNSRTYHVYGTPSACLH